MDRLTKQIPSDLHRAADCEKTQAPISERDYNLMQGAGQCVHAMTDEEMLAEIFRYHAPNEITIPKYAAINQAAKNFAEVVMANCRSGSDRAAAINCIRMARTTAN